MKTCRRCRVQKPLSDFYGHARSSDGKNSYCKACARISVEESKLKFPEKHKETRRLWRERNIDKIKQWRQSYRERHRPRLVLTTRKTKLSKLGMSEEQRLKLLTQQGNRCACCGDEFPQGAKICVDHCHNAGHVRGLLCNSCNVAEGLMRTPERVRKLLRYMEANGLFYSIA